MNNIINDISNVLSNLSLPDYILIGAIIVLIILVIALIYVLKNDTIEDNTESFEEHYSPIKEDIKENINAIEEVEQSDSNDLNNIVKSIEETNPPRIDMTMYEQEQENTAIISYEELLKRMNQGSIVEKEEMLDNTISIKKLNFDNTIEETGTNTFANDLKEIKNNIVEEVSENSFLFEYEEQEKFLKALKELDKSLKEEQ